MKGRDEHRKKDVKERRNKQAVVNTVMNIRFP
jgi:hypothetical protein